MKFGWIIVKLIFLNHLYHICEHWKLLPSPFMISKWEYNATCSYLFFFLFLFIFFFFDSLSEHIWKNGKLQANHHWLSINCSRLVNYRCLDLRHSPPNHAEFHLKLLSMTISITIMPKHFTDQKIYSKNVL